jgi:flagellar biogenesis protein FliO
VPTPADPLVLAPDAVPSLWGATLRLALVAALFLGMAAAWWFWQRRVRRPLRQLEVLDQAFLGRGVSVALLSVADRRLLVGVSSEGVRLLRDLESGGPARGARRFGTVLADATAAAGETER